MTDNEGWVPRDIDVETPSAARLYDYFLGGAHHFESDRVMAERVLDVLPEIGYLARVNRSFLRRVTKFFAAQGIDQFLDVGCGLPTTGSVHETVQAINPDARVLYVDSEPVAVAHSELILENNDNASVIQADARDLPSILGHAEAERLLDLSRPVGVLMIALAHFIPDSDDPGGMIAGYRDVMAPGSHLALSHISGDTLPDVEKVAELYQQSQNPAYLRTREQIGALLDGFELVDPGLVFVPQWRPEHPKDAEDAERTSIFGAVGRKS